MFLLAYSFGEISTRNSIPYMVGSNKFIIFEFDCFIYLELS